MDTIRHAMVGRLVIHRPGENAWSKRVLAFGCFGATVEMRMPSSGEGGRFDMAAIYPDMRCEHRLPG
jgi:hypothetical protein